MLDWIWNLGKVAKKYIIGKIDGISIWTIDSKNSGIQILHFVIFDKSTAVI